MSKLVTFRNDTKVALNFILYIGKQQRKASILFFFLEFLFCCTCNGLWKYLTLSYRIVSLSKRSPTKSNVTSPPPIRPATPSSQIFFQKTSERKTLPNYVHLTFTATFMWCDIKLSLKINSSLCRCKSKYLMLYKVGK